MRQVVLLAVFIACLAICGQGHAHSFDCAKASMPSDFVICSDPTLLEANDDLAAQWSAARAQMDQAGKARLLNEQREWMHAMSTRCHLSEHGRPSDSDIEQSSECIGESLAKRTRQLIAERMRNTGCLDFSRYPAEKAIQEPYAEPMIVSPEAKHFRTVIRNGAQGEPDFAGRFRVVQWGCGSNCHLYALIDKKNGSVYMADLGAALGAHFQLDSNLFVVDPPEMIETDWPEGMASTVSYLWDDSSHTLQKIPGCDGYTLKSTRSQR